MVRAKLRTMFERNRNVRDVAVLDVLLLKAQQEYQETMNAWKQTSHVMKWFTEEEVRNLIKSLSNFRRLVRMKCTDSSKTKRFLGEILCHARRGTGSYSRGSVEALSV